MKDTTSMKTIQEAIPDIGDSGDVSNDTTPNDLEAFLQIHSELKAGHSFNELNHSVFRAIRRLRTHRSNRPIPEENVMPSQPACLRSAIKTFMLDEIAPT